VWRDDSEEIFISPDLAKGYYQFAINSKGVLMDSQNLSADTPDSSWTSNAKVEVTVEKNKRWIVTMSVPLAELGAKVGENQTWVLNFNRSKPLEEGSFVESSWSPTGSSSYHDTSGWGKMTKVVIQQ